MSTCWKRTKDRCPFRCLLKIFETYGVEWRDIAEDDDTATLADLRAALHDNLFDADRPDLPQLRAAQIHSPDLVASFLTLHRAYQAATDQLMSLGTSAPDTGDLLPSSPEAAVHNFFRRNHNHFAVLESAAADFWGGKTVAPDDTYAALKTLLRDRLGLHVRLVTTAEMPGTLREYDEAAREVRLSEAMDHPNRVFQLVHVAGLIEHAGLLDTLLSQSRITDPHGLARCRVELTNYFAAAVLMPYAPFLSEALASKYDFTHLATRFGVSFEQACHRATTLQRAGAQGVPFFFVRIDKAGNVTKRFNATDFHLAEYGGAARGWKCTPRFARRGRSCRNSWKCRTAASFSCSHARWTDPACPDTQPTCGWPWPWAAMSNTPPRSAMPKACARARQGPCPSASTAAPARAWIATSARIMPSCCPSRSTRGGAGRRAMQVERARRLVLQSTQNTAWSPRSVVTSPRNSAA